MKMISAGASLGVGVKDYRVIFVFENDKALTQFLDSGWSVRRKRMQRPKQASRAQHTQERSRLSQECGYIRSPRTASPSR